jgi:hypothetical protein
VVVADAPLVIEAGDLLTGPVIDPGPPEEPPKEPEPA